MTVKRKLINWLKRQSANQRKVLNRFFTGSFVFFVGLVVFSMAEMLMQDSIEREWVTLFGVFLIVIGFVLAMFGYMSMLFWRFWKYFD